MQGWVHKAEVNVTEAKVAMESNITCEKGVNAIDRFIPGNIPKDKPPPKVPMARARAMLDNGSAPNVCDDTGTGQTKSRTERSTQHV